VITSHLIVLQPQGKPWISRCRDSNGKTWTGDFIKGEWSWCRPGEPHGYGVLVHPLHEQLLESEEGTMVCGRMRGMWVQKYRDGSWNVHLYKDSGGGLNGSEVLSPPFPTSTSAHPSRSSSEPRLQSRCDGPVVFTLPPVTPWQSLPVSFLIFA
jgi:hypothetical protein